MCWPGLSVHAHAHYDESGPLLAARFGLHVRAVEPRGWTTAALPAAEYLPTALARRVAPLLAGGAVFAGWSWGASVGVHLGAAAPGGLRALVLLDAGYTDLQDDPAFQEKSLEERIAALRANAPRFTSWEACVEDARGRTRAWRPALEARARAGMREEHGAIVPLVAPEPVAAALHGVALERPSLALARIRVPVLLVAATETLGRLGPAPLERFRLAVPHAEVVTVESGHDVLAEAPDETLGAVGSFLVEWAG